jgi:hypothetical protein
MDKIATPSDLITQLSALKERVSSEPVSRDVVASELRALADKISAGDQEEDSVSKDYKNLEGYLKKARDSWEAYRKDPRLDKDGKSKAMSVAHTDFLVVARVFSRVSKLMDKFYWEK